MTQTSRAFCDKLRGLPLSRTVSSLVDAMFLLKVLAFRPIHKGFVKFITASSNSQRLRQIHKVFDQFTKASSTSLAGFILLIFASSIAIRAPQTSIPPAASILGTIGTVFWCLQLVPQIWHNYKLKKTEGMPGYMMFLWALGRAFIRSAAKTLYTDDISASVFFGVYTVVQVREPS